MGKTQSPPGNDGSTSTGSDVDSQKPRVIDGVYKSHFITDNELYEILRNNPEITELDLTYHLLTPGFCPQGSGKVRVLKLSNMLSEEMLENFLKAYPALEELIVEANGGVSLSDDFRFPDNTCKALQKLILNEVAWKDKVLKSILEACPKLRHLELVSCHGLTADFRCPEGACQLLETLGFSDTRGIGDEAVVSFLRASPGLKYLRVYHGKLTADFSFPKGAGKHLEVLIFGGYIAIGNEAIGSCLEACPKLKELNIYEVKLTADFECPSGTCRDLRKLVFSKTEKIGNKTVASFLKNCPSLRGLYLYRCHGLTSDFSCPDNTGKKLEEVYLGEGAADCDRVRQSFLKSAPKASFVPRPYWAD